MKASRIARALGAVIVACVTPGLAAAQSSDSAAVIRAAETLLRAISSRDTALARTVLLPGAMLASVRDPAPATVQARVLSDAEFYRTLPEGNQVLLERMWSPTVTLHGALAVVSTPYDFHIDGKFSHCGIDVFLLLRSNDAWRISSVTYTVQRGVCAPSPLGPPRH